MYEVFMLFNGFDYKKEYLIEKEIAIVKEMLREYMMFGGFPEASCEEEIEKREKKALIKASEELNCDDMLVITWDYEAEDEFKGKMIKFTPLWKWLIIIDGF